MKMRHRRKQFWWTWHFTNTTYSSMYGWFDWGIGRIKQQHPDCIKDRGLT